MAPTGRRQAAAGVALVGTVAFVASLGCTSPSDCFGVHKGDRIAITIVDTYEVPGEHVSYDAGRSDICGFGFDLSQGQVLIAQDSENIMGDDGVCKGAITEFQPFGNWSWTLSGTQSTGTRYILGGEYEGTNGICTGHVQVGLVVTPGADPFAKYVPGGLPNVYLSRTFSGATATCQKSCYGTFIVNLKRI